MKLYNMIDLVKHLAHNIPNVNTVIVGDVYDLNTIKDIEYSAIVITEQTHTINNADDLDTYNLNIFYVDRQTSDNTNVLDIHSHAIEVLKMLLNQVEESGVIISNEYQINTFKERFDSLCAGAFVNVELMTKSQMCGGFKLVTSVNGMVGDVVLNIKEPTSEIDYDDITTPTNSKAVVDYVEPINTKVNDAAADIHLIYDELSILSANKQDLLVSGANIKTVNGESILGSGDITTDGAFDIESDANGIGIKTKSTTKPNTIEGATKYGVTVLGYGNKASGYGAFVTGTDNSALGARSFVGGRYNVANGLNSVIIGYCNELNNNASQIYGDYNLLNGVNSFILGANTVIDSNTSISLNAISLNGKLIKTDTPYVYSYEDFNENAKNVLENGKYYCTSNTSSIAQRIFTYTINKDNKTITTQTILDNDTINLPSCTLGNGNINVGLNMLNVGKEQVGIGFGNTIEGDYSQAHGLYNHIKGKYNFSFGRNNSLLSSGYSNAFGEGLTTKEKETVIGQYNLINEDLINKRLVTIGGGVNEENKYNILESYLDDTHTKVNINLNASKDIYLNADNKVYYNGVEIATTDDLLTYVTEDKTNKDVYIEPQHSVSVNTDTFLYNGYEVATKDDLSAITDRLTTAEGNITAVNNRVSSAETKEAQLQAEIDRYKELLLLVNAKCVYTDFDNVKHAASANMAAVISTVKESKIIHITGNMDGIIDAAHWFEGTDARVTPCEEIEEFDASQIQYFYATFNKAKVLLPQHLNCYNNKTFVGCFDGYKGVRLPSKIECGSLQIVNASNYQPMYNNGYRGDIDPWRYCFSSNNQFTNLPTFNGLRYSPSAGNGRFNTVSTITPTADEWKNFCEGLANPISGYNNFSFHTTVWNRIKALSNFAQYKQVAIAKGWTFND